MLSLLLAIVAGIALAVCVCSLIALHLLPTGLNPLRAPVSMYGTTRYSILYRIQVVASGICALCLLVALDITQKGLPAIGLLILGLYGVARLCIVGFMMDIPGKRTREGRIHIILAAVAFSAIAVTTVLLTATLSSAPRWNGVGLYLFVAEQVTLYAAILFVIVSLVSMLISRFSGLVERGIYLGGLCWLGLVLVQLLH